MEKAKEKKIKTLLLMSENGESLIRFECECNEASRHFMFYGAYVDVDIDDTLAWTRFKGLDELKEYGKGKDLYFYRLESIKPVDPFPASELYEDRNCSKPLTAMPKTYRFAYERKNVWDCRRWANQPKDIVDSCLCDGSHYYRIERILVFSVKSLSSDDIVAGKKDVEVIPWKIRGAGILYS